MAGWRGVTVVSLCLAAACGTGTGGSTARLPDTSDGGESGATDGGSPGGLGSSRDGGNGSDAGTGGSDVPDGGDGGPGGGGQADGGTTPADGGTGGPLSCPSPAPADVCQTLNPPLGAPVVHRESPVPFDTGTGVSCGTGAYPASGTGVVLHPMQPQGRPPRFDFVDPAGKQIASFGDFSIATFGFDVVPQTSGFAILDGYLGGLGAYPVDILDDHSGRRGGTGGLKALELPGGGVGVFKLHPFACGEADGIEVQRFSDVGVPAQPDPTPLRCPPGFSVMAGNGSGTVLVLLAAVSGTYTGWDAFWLDADLHVLQKFTAPELAAAVNNRGAAIAALLDGSFVLRFDQQWKYRIQPNSTGVDVAPCWLSERPGTDLHVVRGRAAYALTRLTSSGCDGEVEILTPDGQTCGPVGPLGEPDGGQCDVAIGRDGTISRSAGAVGAGPGQPTECLLEFWPGALGRSGF
jgi:hypothetical protein